MQEPVFEFDDKPGLFGDLLGGESFADCFIGVGNAEGVQSFWSAARNADVVGAPDLVDAVSLDHALPVDGEVVGFGGVGVVFIGRDDAA